jgi:hypothetical protein
MALRRMGVATDIVNLVFGLLLGAIAVAIALAFGLGGREIAAEQVREWLASFKQARSSRASTASTANVSPSATTDWPSTEEIWSPIS